jgi:RIO kinase 2
LGYSGHDYLALKAFSKKGVIYAVGPQVGTGKESDVFTCTGDDESGKKLILKIHRYSKSLGEMLIGLVWGGLVFGL